MKTNDQLV